MRERYLTVRGTTEYEFDTERSRFIGIVTGITCGEDAEQFLIDVRQRFRDATHVCYAYLSDMLGNSKRFSDDGEPQGTAGLPILDILEKKGVVLTAAAVVRYYGGIKLGANGLVRAYSAAASEAVTRADLVWNVFSCKCRAVMEYPIYSKVEKAILRFPIDVESVAYEDRVLFDFFVPETDRESVAEKLTDLCLGKIKVEELKKEYHSFKRTEP